MSGRPTEFVVSAIESSRWIKRLPLVTRNGSYFDSARDSSGRQMEVLGSRSSVRMHLKKKSLAVCDFP